MYYDYVWMSNETFSIRISVFLRRSDGAKKMVSKNLSFEPMIFEKSCRCVK